MDGRDLFSMKINSNTTSFDPVLIVSCILESILGLLVNKWDTNTDESVLHSRSLYGDSHVSSNVSRILIFLFAMSENFVEVRTLYCRMKKNNTCIEILVKIQ